MKTFLTIVLLALVFPCLAQQNTMLTYPNEITYRGDMAYYHGSPYTGLLIDKKTNKQLGKFKNGLKNGVFTEYYPNLKKKSIVNYLNGNKEGLCTEWFENGEKHLVAHYVHNRLDSDYIQYYDNGKIEVKFNYNQGKREDGRYLIYDKEGQKAEQLVYKGGVEVSKGEYKGNSLFINVIKKYPDGTKMEEGYTKDGLKDGLWTEWFENGQKSKAENYKEGEKDGISTWWYSNGDKKKEVQYQMGNEVKVLYENNLNPAWSIKTNRKPGSYIYRIIDRVDGDTAYVMVVMNFDIVTRQNGIDQALTSYMHDLIASFTEYRFQKMSYSDISQAEDKPLSYSVEFSQFKWGLQRTNSAKVRGSYWYTGSITLNMKISNLISDSVIFNKTLESYNNIYYGSEYHQIKSLSVFKGLPYELSGLIMTDIYSAFKLKAKVNAITKSRNGIAKEVSVSDDLSSSWKGFSFLVYTKDDTKNPIARIEKVNKNHDDHRYKVINGGGILVKYLKQGKTLVAISSYKF